VEQPRATHPAWTARDLEQSHFSYLPMNPQEHVCRPFQNNLSTRILEKDYFNRGTTFPAPLLLRTFPSSENRGTT
jgi:hypothetical protein